MLNKQFKIFKIFYSKEFVKYLTNIIIKYLILCYKHIKI